MSCLGSDILRQKKAINRKIERVIHEDKTVFRSEIKLLLLGLRVYPLSEMHHHPLIYVVLLCP